MKGVNELFDDKFVGKTGPKTRSTGAQGEEAPVTPGVPDAIDAAVN